MNKKQIIKIVIIRIFLIVLFNSSNAKEEQKTLLDRFSIGNLDRRELVIETLNRWLNLSINISNIKKQLSADQGAVFKLSSFSHIKTHLGQKLSCFYYTFQSKFWQEHCL